MLCLHPKPLLQCRIKFIHDVKPVPKDDEKRPKLGEIRCEGKKNFKVLKRPAINHISGAQSHSFRRQSSTILLPRISRVAQQPPHLFISNPVFIFNLVAFRYTTFVTQFVTHVWRTHQMNFKRQIAISRPEISYSAKANERKNLFCCGNSTATP